MNAVAPPKKERGLGTTLKTTELLAAYRLWPALQAAPLETTDDGYTAVWEREAGRLFREFWRTGNQKHLHAFFTHVVAMRTHQARATQ
jgi:hypothetical protein